jgi:endonuclease YncB( thermonuclease family)
MNSAPTHPLGWRAVAAAIAAAAALALALPAGPAAACGAAAGIVQATAVDERGEIALADGRRLRLAGLDLPLPSRGDPALAASARALLAGLVVGREAALSLVSAAPDRWDRAVGDLDAPISDGAPASAAETLLAAGLARVRPEFETRGCEAGRLALESAARAKGLGVWRDPDYVVLAAADLAALARRDGRFVIVEGVVRRIGLGRARLYLDLGGGGALSVVASRKTQAAFLAAGAPLTALVGEKIRVRGALDSRFGPQLEIVDPLMLERLGRAEAK